MIEARARTLPWGLLLVGANACTPTPPSEARAPRADARPPSADAASPTDASAHAGEAGGIAICGPDVATRRPSAERIEGEDLDADGDVDLIFRDGRDMFGNSEFLYYRVDGACAVYLGAITAFIASAPHCVAPPTRGAFCRLSAWLRMFHDDYQETFYELAGDRLIEAGHGKYTPTPSRRPGKGR